LGSASISTTKEPAGLVRQDGNQLNGLILVPWQGGKSLAWDATVVSTLAQSYRASTGVGMVVELAAERKLMKYSNLPTNLIFKPTAVKNLRAFSSSSSNFISALGHKNQHCVWQRKRNIVLISATFCGIATMQCTV